MIDTDIFSTQLQEDGSCWILKNGEFFISCSTETEAMKIMETLRKDAERDT